MLFDVRSDPRQQHPIEDARLAGRFKAEIARLMRENDAPAEQFARMGLL